MQDARRKILNMVAEGKITVEQADELLSTIAPEPPTPPTPPVPPTSATPPSGFSYSFGNGGKWRSSGFGGSQSDDSIGDLAERGRQLGDAVREFGLRIGAQVVDELGDIDVKTGMAGGKGRKIRQQIRRSARGERIGSNPSVEHLIQLTIHGVKPEYVKALREAGLTDLSIDEVVSLSIHDVSPDFVKKVREATGGELSVDQIVRLAIHDADPETIAETVKMFPNDFKNVQVGNDDDEDEKVIEIKFKSTDDTGRLEGRSRPDLGPGENKS